MRRWPSFDQVRRCVARTALVVDHDRVAGHEGELAVDLDDVDPLLGQEIAGVVADGVMITPAGRMATKVRTPAISCALSLSSTTSTIW